jgi:hypothetical protein
MMICRSTVRFALLSVIAVPLGIADDMERAWNAIRPLIHANGEQKAAAMRGAPLIFLGKIQNTNLYSEPRQVEKPASVGGPMIPLIPLHLAKISAKPLLFMRGSNTGPVEFYSWIWASGKHGGPRLFHATPDSFHVLFLIPDAGYLHTVGDYPSYDIEIRSYCVPNFIAKWESGFLREADMLERIVAVLLKAELESVGEKEASGYWLNTPELVELTSRKFVTGQLSRLCTSLPNPSGRTKACSEYTQWK